jgi:hypothetical protein
MPQDHWLPGFNFNVEEWDAKGQTYETLAICRSLEPAPQGETEEDRRDANQAAFDIPLCSR